MYAFRGQQVFDGRDRNGAHQRTLWFFYLSLETVARRIPNSFNCVLATEVGALVSKHVADWVLGKAMTSRIELDPVNNMANRSIPKAIPPCGGQPNCNASNKNPNFSFASLS